jgi:hypothetical protein
MKVVGGVLGQGGIPDLLVDNLHHNFFGASQSGHNSEP